MFISLEVCLSSGLKHIVMYIAAIISIAIKYGCCATK